MTHSYDDFEDRVIARALDAEETDEAAMDRATLEEYQRVLAHLPFEEIAPPVELEERVIGAALAQRPAAARSISSKARRRATARWVTLGAAVAAAAAVIAFMFATPSHDGHTEPNGRLVGVGVQDIVTPILHTEGTRTATLEVNGVEMGEVALAPNGDGALYQLRLPDAPPNQRLWLWLVTDGTVVPIGPLPTQSSTVGFHVSGEVSAVKGVAISKQGSGTTPDTSIKPTFVATATF
jgi:anti-sigma-K factor RskA